MEDILTSNNWQDSLALSSYLKLRREGRLSLSPISDTTNTPIAPISERSNINNLQTKPQSKQFSITDLNETIPKGFLSFDPVHNSRSNQNRMNRLMDLTPTNLPMTDKDTEVSSFPYSQEGYDESIQTNLNFTSPEPEKDENLDRVALELLLKSALRDKGLLQNQIKSFHARESILNKERSEIISKMEIFTAIISNSKRWRLPCLLIQKFEVFQLKRASKCFNIWSRNIYKASLKSSNKNSNHLVVMLAKRNILKWRAIRRCEFFLRWKTKLRESDQRLELLSGIVKRRSLTFSLRIYLKIFKMKAKFCRFIRRRFQILRRKAMKASFDKWRRFPLLSSHLSFNRMKLFHHLSTFHNFQIAKRINTRFAFHKWRLVVQYQVYYLLRADKMRIALLRVANKKNSHFQRWKKLTLEILPKAMTHKRLIWKLVSRKYFVLIRMVMLQWRGFAASRAEVQAKSVKLFKLAKTSHLRVALGKWKRLSIRCDAKDAKYRYISVLNQRNKLLFYSMDSFLSRCKRTTFRIWQTYTVVARELENRNREVKTVENSIEVIKSSLIEESLVSKKVASLLEDSRKSHQQRIYCLGTKLVSHILMKLYGRQLSKSWNTWLSVLRTSSIVSHMNYQLRRSYKHSYSILFAIVASRICQRQLTRRFRIWRLKYNLIIQRRRSLKCIYRVIRKVTIRSALLNWKQYVMMAAVCKERVTKDLFVTRHRVLTRHFSAWKRNVTDRSSLKRCCRRMMLLISSGLLKKRFDHWSRVVTGLKLAKISRFSELHFHRSNFYTKRLYLATWRHWVIVRRSKLKAVKRLLLKRALGAQRQGFRLWVKSCSRIGRVTKAISLLYSILTRSWKANVFRRFRRWEAMIQSMAQAIDHQSFFAAREQELKEDEEKFLVHCREFELFQERLSNKINSIQMKAIFICRRYWLKSFLRPCFISWRSYSSRSVKLRWIVSERRRRTKAMMFSKWRLAAKLHCLRSEREDILSTSSRHEEIRRLMFAWRINTMQIKHRRNVFLKTVHCFERKSSSLGLHQAFYTWHWRAVQVTRWRLDISNQCFQKWRHRKESLSLGRKRLGFLCNKMRRKCLTVAFHRWSRVLSSLKESALVLRNLLRICCSKQISNQNRLLKHSFSLLKTNISKLKALKAFKRVIFGTLRRRKRQGWTRWIGHVLQRREQGNGLSLLSYFLLRSRRTALACRFQSWRRACSWYSQHVEVLGERLRREHLQRRHKRIFALWHRSSCRLNSLLRSKGSQIASINKALAIDMRELSQVSSDANSAPQSLLFAGKVLIDRLLQDVNYKSSLYFVRKKDFVLFGVSEMNNKINSAGKYSLSMSSYYLNSLLQGKGSRSVRASASASAIGQEMGQQAWRDMAVAAHENNLRYYLPGEGIVGRCAEEKVMQVFYGKPSPTTADVQDEERENIALVITIPLFHMNRYGECIGVLQLSVDNNSEYDLLLSRNSLSTKNKSFHYKKDSLEMFLNASSILQLDAVNTIATLPLITQIITIYSELYDGVIQQLQKDMVDESIDEKNKVFLPNQEIIQGHKRKDTNTEASLALQSKCEELENIIEENKLRMELIQNSLHAKNAEATKLHSDVDSMRILTLRLQESRKKHKSNEQQLLTEVMEIKSKAHSLSDENEALRFTVSQLKRQVKTFKGQLHQVTEFKRSLQSVAAIL